MSTNPFATNEAPPAAENAVPKAPAAETVIPGDAVVSETPTEGDIVKKDRKKPNKQASMDQKQFVITNYASMSRSEIADATGLTGQQVYNIIRSVREAGTIRATVLRENGDEKGATAVEAKIAAAFPKKMTGGKGGGRKKGTDVNALLDELLG